MKKNSQSFSWFQNIFPLGSQIPTAVQAGIQYKLLLLTCEGICPQRDEWHPTNRFDGDRDFPVCAKGSTRCSGVSQWACCGSRCYSILMRMPGRSRSGSDLNRFEKTSGYAHGIVLPARQNNFVDGGLTQDDTDNAEPIRVKDIYPTLKLNLCLRVPTRTGKSRSPSFVFDLDDCLTNQGVRGLFPQG